MDVLLNAAANPLETVHIAPSAIALALDVTTESVNRWIVTGQLEARKFGRSWRVPVASLERFLSQHPHHALKRRARK